MESYGCSQKVWGAFVPRGNPTTETSPGSDSTVQYAPARNAVNTELTCCGNSASHYGLPSEELDFVVNYDIKYRLGRAAGEEE